RTCVPPGGSVNVAPLGGVVGDAALPLVDNTSKATSPVPVMPQTTLNASVATLARRAMTRPLPTPKKRFIEPLGLRLPVTYVQLALRPSTVTTVGAARHPPTNAGSTSAQLHGPPSPPPRPPLPSPP